MTAAAPILHAHQSQAGVATDIAEIEALFVLLGARSHSADSKKGDILASVVCGADSALAARAAGYPGAATGVSAVERHVSIMRRELARTRRLGMQPWWTWLKNQERAPHARRECLIGEPAP